ncbi:MAG: hypothetical protein WC623_23700 [Pedobacter sp.]
MKTHRNKFKRIATITAAVVLLLLLIAYSYLSLRRYNTYKNTIHADAEFIIQLDVDRLYSSLAMDYLSNPSYYRKKSISSIESGLKIPSQIFVYTVKSKSAQTFFCTLSVIDTLSLKLFAKQKLGITSFRNEGQYVTGSNANGRFTIAFNADNFVVGYSQNAENVHDVLIDLLKKQNLLSADDHRLTKLKALKSHLAYVLNDFVGTGDFKNGQLHLEGDFSTEHFVVKDKVFNHRVFDKNAIVKMWFSAAPFNKSYATVKLKSYNLAPDSLLKYYDGYVDLEMGNLVSQTDTVVTYEYNDNFEKEETLTPRTVKVPGINSVIAGNAVGLNNYLSRANVIAKDKVNKELFPLYQLYVENNGDGLMLSTEQNRMKSDLRKDSPYFFYLDVDFEKLKAQGQFPVFEKYISLWSRLIVKANPETSQKNHFELDLHFKRKDINAFMQLQ